MPRYQHHTTEHTFLGTHDKFDLYYCTTGETIGCVVARYGNECDQYRTGLMHLIEQDKTSYPAELVAAYELALKGGIRKHWLKD